MGIGMKYKIGDVAKILGISADLLRYYEKKGVVKPLKDKNNDYRYYEAWDINFLIDCLWFKQFGFGIEQIGQMSTASTYDDIIDLFGEKEAELEEIIKRNQLLLDRARQHRLEITAARACLGKCDIRIAPETVRYINRYNFIYDNSPELHKLSQQWIQYIPFIHRCFEIDMETLTDDESEDYRWGFSLDMQYVREFEVKTDPPVVHLPAQRSVHSVFSSSGKDNFSPRLLDYLVDYARENHLEIVGSARGNLLCSVVSEDRLTGFFEVWLPIAD